MPVMRYRAIDSASERIVTGSADVKDRASFLAEMHKRGLAVTDLSRAWVRATSRPARSSGFAVSKARAVVEIGELVKAGIPLRKAIEYVSIETTADVGVLIRGIMADLDSGFSFTEACSRVERGFSPWEIEAFRTAEISGSLAGTLEYVGNNQLNTAELWTKVRSALVYPMLVIALGTVVLLIMIFFLIPSLLSVLGNVNDLPASTRALIVIQRAVMGNPIQLGIILVLLVLSGRALFDRIRDHLEDVAARIPLIGRLLTVTYLARFCRTYCVLLQSGVPAAEAATHAGLATGSLRFAGASKSARDEVRAGVRLSDGLRNQGIFPRIVVEMVAVGETSGNLSEMLRVLSELYEREAARRAASVSALIEPLTVLMMGSLIGLLALSVFSPMLRVLQKVSI
jgi:type IV pilus assembly protein PilC